MDEIKNRTAFHCAALICIFGGTAWESNAAELARTRTPQMKQGVDKMDKTQSGKKIVSVNPHTKKVGDKTVKVPGHRRSTPNYPLKPSNSPKFAGFTFFGT
ncbi:hypothetical protein DFO70_103434 [Cytobacillus firmus]|uniref:Uncharacterized protein n=2 Tax=Cytobacillus TaxID=2675230 RepID=A0A366K249_CYTFI|nr:MULTISPECIES: hypothetical protein [Cytobacillus]RBP95392.1 hypothetical protein DFO70_103434 [Cytobacillus firmus]TDX44233.1 hypothetical protein DFO72_104447 [Cytobacillus oceanisediminis]